MKKRNAFSVLLPAILGSAALVLLDQAAKLLAARYLKEKPALVLIPGVLELRYLYPENRGMAFGMFQGGTPVFILFTALLMLGLGWLYLRIPEGKHYRLLKLCCILMAGGAAGNCIDRAFRHYVIDFIYVSLIDFPIFNVADICVVISGALFVIACLFVYKDQDFAFISLKKKG